MLRYKIPFSYDAELDKRDSKLLTFDFAKPDQDPIEVTLKNFNRTGFNPHGITVYQDPSSNRVSLFVINHRLDAQAIEIFDLERASHSLVHRRSVVDPLIWSPNNLYAVGKDIYVIHRPGGPYWEKLCPRSRVRPEAAGRGPYSRHRAQFFPIRTDQGRSITFLFISKFYF